jgi:hypothetical protein
MGLICEQSLLILSGQQVRPLNLGRIELCLFQSGETIRVVWWAGCARVCTLSEPPVADH